jgi:ferritin-like metal-binding protein YciE
MENAMNAWTNETARSLFVDGLKNAHALENQALSIMNRQVERLDSYPELSARLRRHITETETQMQRIEQLLDGMGESHSSLKDAALSLGGNLAALGHAFAGDEVLKNSFADLAFENFEIASYKSLLTLAEAGGSQGAMPLLQTTLNEEQEMAAWLNEQIPTITRQYLALEQSGRGGKS